VQEGDEYRIPLSALLRYGRRVFEAHFTLLEGAGRPLTKGTGLPITDPSHALVFPRAVNRISGPDANSCLGCHNQPVTGGAGDLATNVFVLAQRFDFADFSGRDVTPAKSSNDERGHAVTLSTVGNSRSTPGLFGLGYYEMLARQITQDLQSLRNSLDPGATVQLTSKGIAFGRLTRRDNGAWDTSRVEGIPPESLRSANPVDPPSLIILPFHQAGAVVSIREFTVTSFNQHLGMQATERFGIGTDPDGDGISNELNAADITACALFQAALPVPGRVVPSTLERQNAARLGEAQFSAIGCARCHMPALPLDRRGWIFTEPGPLSKEGTLSAQTVKAVSLDLSSPDLPQPRLRPQNGVIMVPLFTDFKLHDICSGPSDANHENLNQHAKPGSAAFFQGSGAFLTTRLWAVGSKPNYFHHGQFTTLRQAILAHSGEAQQSRAAFEGLTNAQQRQMIEFLKTLQVLPQGTTTLTIAEETQ
jgi:hypothetical protein